MPCRPLRRLFTVLVLRSPFGQAPSLPDTQDRTSCPGCQRAVAPARRNAPFQRGCPQLACAASAAVAAAAAEPQAPVAGTAAVEPQALVQAAVPSEAAARKVPVFEAAGTQLEAQAPLAPAVAIAAVARVAGTALQEAQQVLAAARGPAARACSGCSVLAPAIAAWAFEPGVVACNPRAAAGTAAASRGQQVGPRA